MSECANKRSQATVEKVEGFLNEMRERIAESEPCKKEITVKVGYKYFKFQSVSEAVRFAETACKTVEDDDEVRVVIEFKKDKEEDEE